MTCKHKFACHGCIIEQASEEMMLLYAALKQFITEPNANREKVVQEAVSLKRRISELIVTDYKEEENGMDH